MNQFAFRPTGSTTAALINLVKIISDMLVDYPYVHVITFDVSKAFDSWLADVQVGLSLFRMLFIVCWWNTLMADAM